MEELEVLESIYMEDMIVQKSESGFPTSIQLQLHPATGDRLDKRYVCMTLTFNIPEQYPDAVPEIVITNSRGIADEEVQSLLQALEDKAADSQGHEMLYEIIEIAKDSLTEGNVPYCACTICYEHFTDQDWFTKTDCYHYFHQSCLQRYVKHQQEVLQREAENRQKHTQVDTDQNKIKCPVCREEIEYDSEFLQTNFDKQKDDEIHYQPSVEMKEWQTNMNDLYEKQKEKGGIIDVEAEKNRFLLTEADMDVPVIVAKPDEESSKDVVNDVKDNNKDTKTNPVRFNHNGRGRGRPHKGDNYRDYRSEDNRHCNRQRSWRDNRPRSERDRQSENQKDHPSYNRNGNRDRDYKGRTRYKDSNTKKISKPTRQPSSDYKDHDENTQRSDLSTENGDINDENTSEVKKDTSEDKQKPEIEKSNNNSNRSHDRVQDRPASGRNERRDYRSHDRPPSSRGRGSNWRGDRYKGQGERGGDFYKRDGNNSMSKIDPPAGQGVKGENDKNENKAVKVKESSNCTTENDSKKSEATHQTTSNRGRGHRKHAGHDPRDERGDRYRVQGERKESSYKRDVRTSEPKKDSTRGQVVQGENNEKKNIEIKVKDNQSNTKEAIDSGKIEATHQTSTNRGRDHRKHAGDVLRDGDVESRVVEDEKPVHSQRHDHHHGNRGHYRNHHHDDRRWKGQGHDNYRRNDNYHRNRHKDHQPEKNNHMSGENFDRTTKHSESHQSSTVNEVDSTCDRVNKLDISKSNDRKPTQSLHSIAKDTPGKGRKTGSKNSAMTSKGDLDISVDSQSERSKSCDNKPPGFEVKGPPPGFSEKSVKPPPGF